MNYTKTVWKDLPDTSTPITADKLNNLENGVEYLFENGTGGGDNLPVGVEMDFDGTSQDIPTGWEEVNNPDSYSTSEVKTNKVWIDGKPIYRKVINFTSLSSRTNNSATIDITSLNVDAFVNITGVSTNKLFIVIGDTQSITWNAAKTRIIIYFNNSTAFDCEGYIIVEYTKTTD